MDTPAAPPSRIFLALWPDAATRAALQAHQALWSWSPGARPGSPERLHLTLHFIGNVTAHRVAALQQALPPPGDPFTLELARPAVWSGSGGIAVLEPADVPQALLRLHAGLAHLLAAHGLAVEARPWRPHVTLARRAGGSRPPAALPAVRWDATGSYRLLRTVAGGRYETLQALD